MTNTNRTTPLARVEQECRFVFAAPENVLECVLPPGFDKGIGWEEGARYVVRSGGPNRMRLVREP